MRARADAPTGEDGSIWIPSSISFLPELQLYPSLSFHFLFYRRGPGFLRVRARVDAPVEDGSIWIPSSTSFIPRITTIPFIVFSFSIL